MRVNGVDLSEIAELFGTPTYVVDLDRVKENFLRLSNALKCPHVIAYAYKANHEPEIVRTLAALGSGATVPSALGVMLAKWAGVPPDRTVLVGPSPSLGDLSEAVNFGAIISLESESEAKVLTSIGRASVIVRVNPGIGGGAHPSLVTGGRGSKFGLPPERALSLYNSLKYDFKILGFHTHIGSQILSVEPFKAALNVLRDLVRRVGDVELIDLGGGIGVPYSNEEPFPLEEYASLVCSYVREVGATLFLETGRYIVADAGYLLARVNYVKEVEGVKWVLVDAGMNDLIRPALYGAKHEVMCGSEGAKERVIIAGPICESADVFGDYELPELREGDLIAFKNAGAYGFSMASRYNLRPLPPVVVVEGGKFRLLRAREDFQKAIFGN
ncbi:MAG: diaminopimelate decarboxylase [Candidatus Korarchaeum sp.]|nr:diaminopimelate decarboxylase [Candidatus Korarchaeum sp.]